MTEPVRVLVADDEPNLRRVLTAVLKRDGHDVVLATDGAEAVAALDGVDVVITDLRMPRLDGMEVLRHWRAQGITMPVLLLTELPDGGYVLPPEQFASEVFGLGLCFMLRHADGEREGVFKHVAASRINLFELGEQLRRQRAEAFAQR